MDSTKRDAILAFYNSFSDELQTELCTCLADVGFLLHTVVTFIKEKKLEFRDHTKFGFSETVSFLQDLQPNLGNRIIRSLAPNLADEGDELEIGKILLALIYAIRLERSNELIAYVKHISDRHNKVIASMIDLLDQEELELNENENKNNSDVLASVLQTASASERRKSSSSSSCTPTNVTSLFYQRSPFMDLSNNNMRLPGINETPFSAATLQSSNVYGDDSTRSNDSPIASVVRSPRGRHIDKIRQLTRECEHLKLLHKSLVRESDEYKHDAERDLREKDSELKRLQKKYELVCEKASRMEEMKQHVASVDLAIAELKLSNDNLENELQRMRGVRGHLMSEYDKTRKRIDVLEERNRFLENTNTSLRRELDDAREVIEFTNSNLSTAECQLEAYRTKYTDLCDKHKDELDAKDRDAQAMLLEKTDELRKQLETAELVKEQHFNEILQLREALKSKAKQCAEQEVQTDPFEPVKTIDDFDPRYFTPRSDFGKMSMSPSTSTAPQTIDIFNTQEHDFLSQNSTDGDEETLAVEHSPTHSRHSTGDQSVIFFNSSDGRPLRSVATQANMKSKRRLSIRNIIRNISHARYN